MGRGRSQASMDMIVASRRILTEIQPATVRAVAYRLFNERMISSMSRNETNRVSRQLTAAREEGAIPWEWIVDETRSAERVGMWDSPEQIINTATKQYRRNVWKEQNDWVEVWSEKGTVRGTLAPVLNKYGVTFRVMHGYGSATAVHDIAEESGRCDRPLTVLYVGDYDCSGMHMSERDLPDRIARYGGDIDIIRVALTGDDVWNDTDLPPFPAKTADPRFSWYADRYGTQCWELDALSPAVLRDRVGDAIVARIDQDVWNHSAAIERAEVESMRHFADRWRESILVPVSKYSTLEGRP